MGTLGNFPMRSQRSIEHNEAGRCAKRPASTHERNVTTMPIVHENDCYCNVTRRWFTPRTVAHGQGRCPFCDADRTAYETADYARPRPQWHPVLSTLAAAKLRARLMQEEACHA